MPATRRVPGANRLIATLSLADRRRLLANCECVELTLADVLSAPGERIRHVYFPTESFISLMMPHAGAASLEAGSVGNEGILGISLLLGVDVSPLHALAQGRGAALWMNARLFRRELARSRGLDHGLQRYAYVFMDQVARTACTRFHLLEVKLKLPRFFGHFL